MHDQIIFAGQTRPPAQFFSFERGLQGHAGIKPAMEGTDKI
jgi:hypothetical protein